MELKLKENYNISSITMQHNILLQALTMLEGREGALETEKKLYLIVSLVNNLVEEDLLENCNKDERDLPTILINDIEPFFIKICEEDNKIKEAYNYMEKVLLDRCNKIWDDQHSLLGIMDAVLTTIGAMTEEDKKEVLLKTGEIAEQAFNYRTEKMEEATKETNTKLEALIAQYQKQDNIKETEEVKEENDAE